MSKSHEMEVFLEDLAGRSTALAAKKCLAPPLGCGNPVGPFRDQLSAKEYAISGFCQDCQDRVFGGGDGEGGEELCDNAFSADCACAPYSNPRDHAIRQAQDNGFVVFDATPAVGTIITLDLDGTYTRVLETQLTDIFGYQNFNFISVRSKSWSTKGSHHVYIYLPFPVKNANVCSYLARQLGSDEVHERAALENFQNPNDYQKSYLMFETPEAAIKIREWLRTIPKSAARLVREVTE